MIVPSPGVVQTHPILSGRVRLALCAHISPLSEMMRSRECFFAHASNITTIAYNLVNNVVVENRDASFWQLIGGIMVSVLASSAVDLVPFGSNIRLWYWYLLLLCQARSIKELGKWQVGSGSALFLFCQTWSENYLQLSRNKPIKSNMIRKTFLDSSRRTFMNISKFKRLGVKVSEKLIFMVFKSDDMEWYWLLDFSTGLIIVYLLCLTMTLCTI
jgi:hypothetical protein